ncbi:hypothetical protein BKA62DRAFT_689670 [Auriculariales sp. MPI-PUGE-AT-0066]|nr:hypothetical protein BKA62DRAFT_689670 [Auriculariales sp. MPI-PUGE-AT-0066]
MPAPTLLQTLLNRPSQTYSNRVPVTGGPHGAEVIQRHAKVGIAISRGTTPATKLKGLPSIPVPVLPYAYQSKLDSPPARKPKRRSLAAVVDAPFVTTAGPAAPLRDNDDGGASGSGSDVYFTPDSSPAESPQPVKHFLPPTVIISQPEASSSKILEGTSVSISSASSTSEDTFSDYSWERSDSSRTSQSTHQHVTGAPKPRPQQEHMAASVLTPPRVSHAFPRRLSSKPARPEWAKDVRWLVSPASAPSSGYARAPGHASPPRARHSQRGTPSRTTTGKERMSALVEEDNEDSIDLGDVREFGVARSRSLSAPAPSTPAVSPGVSSATGYTSLVLPLAAYTPSKNPAQTLASNTVDLPRSGIAQTTMATISITKNGASQASSRASKRLSVHGLFGNLSSPSVNTATPEHLLASAPSPLAFTSVLPPPSKFGSNQVVVQVWAVALDRLDALIVTERASKGDGSGYGFIPGRGFVGRVVETGVEVSNVKNGDWVYGIFEVKKCGALCEFVAIDRRRVHHIPQVFRPPAQPVQPISRLSRVFRSSSPPPPPPLTLEHIAFLALAGVPAHRAVRCLAPSIATASYDTPKRPARALVLQGHDGVGFLAIQELVAQRVHVVAQVPPSHAADTDRLANVEIARAAGASHVLVGEPEDVLDDLRDMLVSRLSWNDDGPGLDEFDCFVDTVGGKSIWEQAIYVMRDGGQFVTTVGDQRNGAGSSFTAGAHFRHNIRAMQRAFTQSRPSSPSLSGARTPKSISSPSAGSSRRNSGSRDTPSPSQSMFTSLSAGESLGDLSAAFDASNAKSKKAQAKTKKQLGYMWVSAAADVDADGEDVRDTLAEVARLAQAGTLRPSFLAGWQSPGAATTWTRARSIQLARRAASEDSVLGLPMNVVGAGTDASAAKIVPFERTPDALRILSPTDDKAPPIDLDSGGVVVVRVVG